MSCLLDADVLIALTNPEQVHADRADRWFAAQARAAISTMVEGALVRYPVRNGVGSAVVQQLVRGSVRIRGSSSGPMICPMRMSISAR